MTNKDEVIGNSRRNLVLKTAGIIRVLVGDKYYNINFRSSEEEQEDKDEEITSSFIIANNIRDYEDGTLEYPGEKRIIFTLDGGIYYTLDGDYRSYSVGSINTDVITEYEDTVSFNATQPFSVVSNEVIPNLNSRYLNGYTENDFVKSDSYIKLDNLTLKTLSVDDILSCRDDKVTMNGFISGNLSGEENDLFLKSGTLIRSGCLVDPLIVNKIEHKSLEGDYTLDIPNIRDYSITSNGFKVLFPTYAYSGMIVNIYVTDDTIINNGSDVECLAGSYNVFRCIPTGVSTEWIHINRDNTII